MNWDFDEAVVIDVITTGNDPEKDYVVCIAAVRCRFVDFQIDPRNVPLEFYYSKVRSKREHLANSSEDEGIDNNNLEETPTFGEIAEELRDFIGVRAIIAHNASFAKKFLSAEFKRAGVKTLHRNRSFCTMRRFNKLTGLPHDSDLDTVVDFLEVDPLESNLQVEFNTTLMILKIAYMFYMHDKGFKKIILPEIRRQENRSTTGGWLPAITGNGDAGCMYTLGCILIVFIFFIIVFILI